MGDINLNRNHLDRLLTDSAGTHAAPYQQAFAELAGTHRGRPAAEILPLLSRAADRALLGFSRADLHEQAQAISGDRPYLLRATAI
ncbi:hypothetical protein [Streptomyces sp. NPDC002602]|uniref:hypothetical protein n=1 Tax=Streptomyces sp. NPDC002602 TaxID=3364654 RepID=UPI0036A2D001